MHSTIGGPMAFCKMKRRPRIPLGWDLMRTKFDAEIEQDDAIAQHREELHDVLHRGQVTQVSRLLHAGQVPCTFPGLNCFVLAHCSGNWNVMKQLVKARPEGVTAAVGPQGKTLLMLENTDPDRFTWLLRKGAVCDHAVLMNAVRDNAHLHVLRKILAADGVDANAMDATGVTPLIALIESEEHDECSAKIKAMLKAGVDPNVKDARGRTALLVAAKNSARCDNTLGNLMVLLQSGVDPNVTDPQGKTALHLLLQDVERRDVTNKVKELLKAGANPMAQDALGLTPLMQLCITQMGPAACHVLDLLIGGGADIMSQDYQGRTALHHLVLALPRREDFNDPFYKKYLGLLELAGLLMAAGADVYAMDAEQNTPLSLAFQLPELCAVYRCWLYQGEINFDKSHVKHASVHGVIAALLRHGVREPRNVPPDTHPLYLLNKALSSYPNPVMSNDWLVIYTKLIFLSYFKLTTVTTSEWVRGTSNKRHYKDELGWTSFPETALLDTVGCFIVGVSRFHLMKWLEYLKFHGFPIKSNNPNVVSALTLLACHPEFRTAECAEVAQYLMREDVSCTQSMLTFNEHANVGDLKIRVPDVLWIAAKKGAVSFVRSQFAYWTAHPATLLLYLDFQVPYVGPEERDVCNRHKLYRNMSSLLPVVLEVGGPVPHGTHLYARLKAMLESCDIAIRSVRCLRLPATFAAVSCNHMECRLANKEEGEETDNILYKQFLAAHSSIASLRDLSRTALRANMPPGKDLPQRLASLLPPCAIALRNYVTFVDTS